MNFWPRYEQFLRLFRRVKEQGNAAQQPHPLGDEWLEPYQALARAVLCPARTSTHLAPADAAKQATALWYSKAKTDAVKLAPSQTEAVRRAILDYKTHGRTRERELADLQKRRRS